MYAHDDHTLNGYPYTDHLPVLDLSADISSRCLTTTYSGEGKLDTMAYNTISGNEDGSYISPKGVLQRSVSSHSFQKNLHTNNNSWFTRMGLESNSELECNPVRKVFSTGDLQKINTVQHYSQPESSISSESSSIIESITKACPYSQEEKKERIERYRSKRIQRNFTKKIKYECRKTLADSRPRVKGRFARNDEIEKSSQPTQWSNECVEEDDEDDYNWLNFLDTFSTNIVP